jgi:hypothetical protein
MTAPIAPCPCGIGDLYEPADAELDICVGVGGPERRLYGSVIYPRIDCAWRRPDRRY